MLKYVSIASVLLTVLIMGCSGSKDNADQQSNVDKGVGPVKSLSLASSIDDAIAKEGEQLFITKCSACHKLDQKYVGPPLRGVTKRRAPEWIMNMILNPDKMTKENAAAKELLATYMTQMTNQNIAEPEARKILEYFRSIDK
jgi:mono/diheme cytochrome c family protein